MNYITHHRCREKSMLGKELNIPFGTPLIMDSNIIKTSSGEALCYSTSENAHKYFARNDDGQGLRRGALTYAIAYSQRERKSDDGMRRQRFTDAEIETICKDWEKYLVPDIDVVLFNHNFFNAEVDDLEKMAKALNIQVKAGD